MEGVLLSDQAHIVVSLQNGRRVNYYPPINLFSFGQGIPYIDPGFHEILFDYFSGIRKLIALKESLHPPSTFVLDPYRTCNLVCKYCYAGSGPQLHKRVRPETVDEIIERYKFKSLMVFGGEPLIDESLITHLINKYPMEDYFFSTNGLLLNKQFIDKLVNKKGVHVQISLEPVAWKQRINIKGETQFDLLSKKFPLLGKIDHLHFRVTIPSDVPYVPIREFIDYLISAVGRSDFSIFYWPVRGKKLSRWLSSWVSESKELLLKDKLKYGNKIVSEEIFQIFLKEVKTRGFRPYNCTAAYDSISIGPDSRIHACHESGVLEKSEDVISRSDDQSLIDENRKLNWIYQQANNMYNRECRDCPAKFLCGGICFLESDKPQSTCKFIRELIPLAIEQYAEVEPAEFEKFISLSEKRFWELYSKKEELKKEVRDKEWMELVSGELPLEKAVELAKKL